MRWGKERVKGMERGENGGLRWRNRCEMYILCEYNFMSCR